MRARKSIFTGFLLSLVSSVSAQGNSTVSPERYEEAWKIVTSTPPRSREFTDIFFQYAGEPLTFLIAVPIVSIFLYSLIIEREVGNAFLYLILGGIIGFVMLSVVSPYLI